MNDRRLPFLLDLPASCRPWILSPLAGALGGYLAQLMGWPLPWLLGALLGVAAIRCLGCPTEPMPLGLKAGQWILGIGIGLYFNAAVLEQILDHLGLVLVGRRRPARRLAGARGFSAEGRAESRYQESYCRSRSDSKDLCMQGFYSCVV